jgi:hypothetical protein
VARGGAPFRRGRPASRVRALDWAAGGVERNEQLTLISGVIRSAAVNEIGAGASRLLDLDRRKCFRISSHKILDRFAANRLPMQR